jgi:glycosyltransferase involved in cell wall biosynthesis
MIKDFISVITPIYNAEAYLDEAIASVFHQDYEHWELILVDDGSSDHSFSIALSW